MAVSSAFVSSSNFVPFHFQLNKQEVKGQKIAIFFLNWVNVRLNWEKKHVDLFRSYSLYFSSDLISLDISK